jgi:hypothetical protein
VKTKAGSQETFPHSINQTLTRRFEHPVMRPMSFHMLDETSCAAPSPAPPAPPRPSPPAGAADAAGAGAAGAAEAAGGPRAAPAAGAAEAAGGAAAAAAPSLEETSKH